MMQENLLNEGLELMLFGMGTVFVFLTVLVLVTMLMSAIVQRFFPDAPEQTLTTTPRPAPVPASNNDEQLLAVITAAVHKFRSRK